MSRKTDEQRCNSKPLIVSALVSRSGHSGQHVDPTTERMMIIRSMNVCGCVREERGR